MDSKNFILRCKRTLDSCTRNLLSDDYVDPSVFESALTRLDTMKRSIEWSRGRLLNVQTCPDQLLTDIAEYIQEVQTSCQRAQQGFFSYQAPLTWSGAVGPPHHAITREQLSFLQSSGFTVQPQVTDTLRVSKSTVKRRLRQFNLTRAVSYSAMTDLALDDMVKELVAGNDLLGPEAFDPLTVMVLINYVYFRGKWEKPFDANLTQKANFHMDNVTTVQVDMMMRHGEYYYYYEDHANSTQVILLLYKGNSSMLIMLPYEGKMSEVEGYITKDHIKHWHDKLLRRSVDLFLPKFSISAEASLDETLKALGITSAFEDIADFSGISREKRLKISKVSHKAVLSVDEMGTEAAAATTIEVTTDSLPDTVKLDRPFLVFILEHYTKSILFMGKITDPTAH